MAKKQNRIAELRKEVDQLRKSYTGAMSSANKAVYKGIERLAEHELAAIKKHYEEALKNIKKLRKGGDPRDIATAQLKLLQDTIDRIMQNARESMSILDDTRKQISTDIRKELQKAEKKTGTSTTGAGKTAKSSSAKSTAKSGTGTARKKTAARKTTAKSGSSASRAKKSTASGGSAKKASTAKSKSASTGRKTAARKSTSTRRKSTAAKTTTGTSGGTSGGSGGATT